MPATPVTFIALSPQLPKPKPSSSSSSWSSTSLLSSLLASSPSPSARSGPSPTCAITRGVASSTRNSNSRSTSTLGIETPSPMAKADGDAGTSEGAEGVVGPPEAIDDALVRAVVFLTVANGSEQAARSSRLPKVHVAHRFLHHSSFLDLCSSPAGSSSGHPNCFTHSSRASVTETVPSHVERTPRSGGDGRTGSSVPLLTWNTKRCA